MYFSCHYVVALKLFFFSSSILNYWLTMKRLSSHKSSFVVIGRQNIFEWCGLQLKCITLIWFDLNLPFTETDQSTVLNVGTEIMYFALPCYYPVLRTLSDSTETYIKRFTLKNCFQKSWILCGEMRRKHDNFCECKRLCI